MLMLFLLIYLFIIILVFPSNLDNSILSTVYESSGPTFYIIIARGETM